jgi:hypothetical protein
MLPWVSPSKYEFEVDERGWVERSLRNDTARWSWHVKPKVGGRQTIVLYVRPILRVREEGSPREVTSSGDASPEELDVQTYESKVDVKVPLLQRPSETVSSLAGTFKVAETMVLAVTGLIVALGSLAGALGIRRRRKPATEGQGADGGTAPPEPDKPRDGGGSQAS